MRSSLGGVGGGPSSEKEDMHVLGEKNVLVADILLDPTKTAMDAANKSYEDIESCRYTM